MDEGNFLTDRHRNPNVFFFRIPPSLNMLRKQAGCDMSDDHLTRDCHNHRTSNDENCLTSTAPELKSSAAPPFQCRHSATTSSRNTVALFTFDCTLSHGDDRDNFRTSPLDMIIINDTTNYLLFMRFYRSSCSSKKNHESSLLRF